MALPFINKKKDAGGIATTLIEQRNPGNAPEEQNDEEYSLDDCARDILDAIHNNDHEALADSLREAFEKLEQEPHEEAEHSPHTYDDQMGNE